MTSHGGEGVIPANSEEKTDMLLSESMSVFSFPQTGPEPS